MSVKEQLVAPDWLKEKNYVQTVVQSALWQVSERLIVPAEQFYCESSSLLLEQGCLLLQDGRKWTVSVQTGSAVQQPLRGSPRPNNNDNNNV